MNVVETEWWTLALPPEWWADAEDEGILIGDRDDVGCIEITTLHKDEGDFTREELQEIAATQTEQAIDWHSVALGDFSGLRGSYLEEGAAIREWYVAAGALLLFITYSCDEDNRGMDDASVDELLDTLLLVQTLKK